MIRVGFILEFAGDGWLGGLSYYRNLFSAVRDLPGRRIEPVLITSGRSFAALQAQFPDVPIVRLSLLDAPSPVGRARRVLRVLSGRDPLMERALRAQHIALVSHSSYFGRRSSLASIVWIPDFQELTFPEFFSRRELASRHRNVVRCSRHASTVLLSSEAALADFQRVGAGNTETVVLPFVATVPSSRDSLPRGQLSTKYGLKDKFFHLPNQFWIHKNHSVVLHAIAQLHRQGNAFQVVATGNTADPRQPNHFSSLITAAGKLGIDDLFKPLGIVPYQDLMSLMRHAIAVINPSKFEGWSTSVEEAKSMGKAIVLSDIAVHREQAPDRAAFFPPDDADALAEEMLNAVRHWNAESDAQFMDRAEAALPARREIFARSYENIVVTTLTRHKYRSDLTSMTASQTFLTG